MIPVIFLKTEKETVMPLRMPAAGKNRQSIRM